MQTFTRTPAEYADGSLADCTYPRKLEMFVAYNRVTVEKTYRADVDPSEIHIYMSTDGERIEAPSLETNADGVLVSTTFHHNLQTCILACQRDLAEKAEAANNEGIGSYVVGSEQ